MASSKAIKSAVVDLLKDLKLDGEPAFTEVVGNPRGEYDSEPLVRVLPGDQTTEKAAYSQQDRSVNLIVRTHLKYRDDGSEFDYMYQLTDLILDSLDKADFEDTLNSQLGTYVLNATRGDWFETDTQTGAVLMCDINVEVRYSKDL